LTILKGELEVASKRSRSPQEYAQVLGSGLDDINSLIRIVDELLTLARFDSKEISLDIRPLYLSSLLTEVVSDMKVLAGQKGIRINLSGEGEISLEADEKQLKKVFVNLLDNAIKYTPSGGAISIGCSHDQSSVKVRISDTGQGIPENELGNIFNRFYRVDKSRSSPGFGLGLSIAKSLIEAHHGSIEVQSIIDQGTAFIISLPRAFKA
jgi:signal transduction histidine kinase